MKTLKFEAEVERIEKKEKTITKKELLSIIEDNDVSELEAIFSNGFKAIERIKILAYSEAGTGDRKKEGFSELYLYQVLWLFINNPISPAKYEARVLDIDSSAAFKILYLILGNLVDGLSPACAVVSQFIALNSKLIETKLVVRENIKMEKHWEKELDKDLVDKDLDLNPLYLKETLSEQGEVEMANLSDKRALADLLERSVKLIQQFLGESQKSLTKTCVSDCNEILKFVWENIFRQDNEPALLDDFSQQFRKANFLDDLKNGRIVTDSKVIPTEPLRAATQRHRFFDPNLPIEEQEDFVAEVESKNKTDKPNNP